MIAGATLSNNQGVAIATNFTNAISSYTSTTLLTPLFAALGNSASANLTPTTLISLETMAANSCPALADSTPEAYASNIGNILGPRVIANFTTNYATFEGSISGNTLTVTTTPEPNLIYVSLQLGAVGLTANTFITADLTGSGGAGDYEVTPEQTIPSSTMVANPSLAAFGNSINGFTGVITDIGNTYLGQGNTTVFAQVFTAAQSYINQNNDFINTAYNSQTYLGSTFTSMNSLITGNLTDINLALPAFGSDLARLGFLIDLINLGNFGLPSTVFRQLATVTNLTPRIIMALKQVNFTTAQIESITDPDATLTDTEEAKLYRAMLLITGQALQQVCDILGITLPVFGVNTIQPQNPGLTSMADLLNPVKIFPTSFPSLTVRTYNQNTTSELRSIYIDSTGTINSKLLQYLPRYVITVVPA
tara:strand:+ start:218 stop:1480 length:1263 start_codon:yes stop_codon:yes gene_type:complete